LPWNSPKRKIEVEEEDNNSPRSKKSFSGLSSAQKHSALQRRTKEQKSPKMDVKTMAEIVVNYLNTKHPMKLYGSDIKTDPSADQIEFNRDS